MLICSAAVAAPQYPAKPSGFQDRCESPNFRKNGKCWKIMRDNENCLVQPIVVELEDQPVFCPGDKIVPVANDHPPSTTRHP
jgi:uncharacterized Zn-finger protein